MAADNLPTEFDVVILGTGLSESVIAAACARVGQRVLHVDRRSYYAANWASFTFNGLLSWIDDNKQGGQSPEEVLDWSGKVESGEDILPLSTMDTSISNLEVFCYTSEEPEEDEEEKKEDATPISTLSPAPQSEGEEGNQATSPTDNRRNHEGETTLDILSESPPEQQDQEECAPLAEDQQILSSDGEPQGEEQLSGSAPTQAKKKKISYTKIVKEGRRFNIDLVSKLMYSRGLLVDLLIKSNVSRYAEFKNVSRILTYRQGKVEQVPCSRADVFGSKELTVVEKRMLMKFLTFCLDYEQHPEEYQDFTERSFWEFLQNNMLTENLQHFVLHSIAMVPRETHTEEGLRSTQHFLRSLGRYGNTPFLFPIYGLGEIPQCFCRMCAVFGGIYCLRHSVQCLVLDKESGRCKAVIDTCGQRISCSHFVVEDGYIREEQRKGVEHKHISRAVLITDGLLLQSESEQQISLVTVPPLEPGAPAVRLVELCSSTMTCMPGTYLVHLTCPSSGSAREDLQPVVSRLFTKPASAGEEGDGSDERPAVLWAVYFNMRDSTAADRSGYDLPGNVHVCSGPDAALGSDHSIRLAQEVFRQLAPHEEFCPPAPNPEDIVYDGDGGQGEGAGFSEAAQAEEGAAEEAEESKEKEASQESSPVEVGEMPDPPPAPLAEE
ncbi:rab proteins geranylgeranyltransferase component A 1 [Scleropages formosus]|uniref:Rab proteins geranylgeranyltransferase component A n=1 Tax=Scleropages formosus TaxID=113540 RepID=A0A8C9SX60_SCLFO|nr:rab proteins geranylgeranyltransferase component A 2-like [Scleropages formosus]